MAPLPPSTSPHGAIPQGFKKTLINKNGLENSYSPGPIFQCLLTATEIHFFLLLLRKEQWYFISKGNFAAY